MAQLPSPMLTEKESGRLPLTIYQQFSGKEKKMNDDLNLLITVLTKWRTMHKIALHVPHGMNKEEWQNWKYFGEPEMRRLYMAELPLHLSVDIETILKVEEIREIVI